MRRLHKAIFTLFCISSISLTLAQGQTPPQDFSEGCPEIVHTLKDVQAQKEAELDRLKAGALELLKNGKTAAATTVIGLGIKKSAEVLTLRKLNTKFSEALRTRRSLRHVLSETYTVSPKEIQNLFLDRAQIKDPTLRRLVDLQDQYSQTKVQQELYIRELKTQTAPAFTRKLEKAATEEVANIQYQAEQLAMSDIKAKKLSVDQGKQLIQHYKSFVSDPNMLEPMEFRTAKGLRSQMELRQTQKAYGLTHVAVAAEKQVLREHFMLRGAMNRAIVESSLLPTARELGMFGAIVEEQSLLSLSLELRSTKGLNGKHFADLLDLKAEANAHQALIQSTSIEGGISKERLRSINGLHGPEAARFEKLKNLAQFEARNRNLTPQQAQELIEEYRRFMTQNASYAETANFLKRRATTDASRRALDGALNRVQQQESGAALRLIQKTSTTTVGKEGLALVKRGIARINFGAFLMKAGLTLGALDLALMAKDILTVTGAKKPAATEYCELVTERPTRLLSPEFAGKSSPGAKNDSGFHNYCSAFKRKPQCLKLAKQKLLEGMEHAFQESVRVAMHGGQEGVSGVMSRLGNVGQTPPTCDATRTQIVTGQITAVPEWAKRK